MNTTDSNLTGTLARDAKWLASHTILLLVVALLVTGGVYGVEGLLSRRASENDAKWQAILKQQTAQTQTLQQQLTVDEQNWTKIQTQLLAQNQTLENTIVKQNQQTRQQQATDQTLSLEGAATRLSQQTGAKPGEVTVMGDVVGIDLPITRSVVSSLDALVGAQTVLQETQAQLANETTLYKNATADVEEQKRLVAAQQQTLVDTQKACKAQVAAVKARSRKNILKAFGIGVGIGIGIGIHYF